MSPALSLSFRAALLAGGAALALSTASAQAPAATPAGPRVEFPQASPKATLKGRVGVTDVEIDYSRPSKKGREVFGGIVPWNEMWRTGANASTKITFSSAVTIEGKEVPAGSYALLSKPGKDEWTVALNKDTTINGSVAAKYKAENDVVSVKVKPQSLATAVETFEIGLTDLTDTSATLYFQWDKTRVPLKLGVNSVAQVSKAIDEAVASGQPLPPGFYFPAAAFYLENGKDLAKALEWINVAIEKNPKAFWAMNKKAEILAKMGKKPEAVAAAKLALETNSAQPDGADPAEKRKSESYIAQWSKG